MLMGMAKYKVKTHSNGRPILIEADSVTLRGDANIAATPVLVFETEGRVVASVSGWYWFSEETVLTVEKPRDDDE